MSLQFSIVLLHVHNVHAHVRWCPSVAAPRAGNEFSTHVYRNSGLALYLQQFVAVFMKRVINSWRSPIVTVVQLAVPFVFALFGCIVEETFPSESRDFDPLVIKFSHFDDPISPYKGACLSRHVTY